MARKTPPDGEAHMTPEAGFGRRIAQLREAAGLTQRELARRMGLTQSALSRIESGSRRLSAAQALRLSRILSVDPGLLLSPETRAQASAAEAMRPDATRGPMTPEATRAGPMWIEERVELQPPVFADVVLDALAVASLEANPSPSLFAALSHAASADPARLARFWRHELGVGDTGPLSDIVPLLEGAGVGVVYARLDSEFPHGACAMVVSPFGPDRTFVAVLPREDYPDDARPFVFVNGFGRPVALQRFALAHGFGHLALGHREAYDERIDWSGRSRLEVEANAFAEEFLAPLAAVRHWFDTAGADDDTWEQSGSRGPGADADLRTIVRLANHFGVSFWVARYRAKAAGVITGPTRVRELDRLLRAQQWQLIPRQLFLGGLRDTLSVLASEARPGAEENALRMAPQGVRVPGSMRAQVLDSIERDVVSLERAATWLRIDPDDLRAQLEALGIK